MKKKYENPVFELLTLKEIDEIKIDKEVNKELADELFELYSDADDRIFNRIKDVYK